MVTERGLAYLKEKYGDHDYNYPLLSDVNIWSVIKNHNCKSFEELDLYCKALNERVREIKEMQAQCHDPTGKQEYRQNP